MPNLKESGVQVPNKLFFNFKSKIGAGGSRMIGPIEKGMKPMQVEAPPKGTYDGVDLTVLPKFIAYKAALIREQVTLKYILFGSICIFSILYLSARHEITSLYKLLRQKEYILAPGVMDFTIASPQTVPNSYVNDAITDLLSNLGNINSNNIDEQYSALKRFMSDELRVKFEIETVNWIEQVKSENISQILTITEREIRSDDKGNYRIVALGRAEFYSDQQYLGHEDQVIEMRVKLVPPESSKRWFLQIVSLAWSKAELFSRKTKLSKGSSK